MQLVVTFWMSMKTCITFAISQKHAQSSLHQYLKQCETGERAVGAKR